jgi:hypothetical protein
MPIKQFKSLLKGLIAISSVKKILTATDNPYVTSYIDPAKIARKLQSDPEFKKKALAYVEGRKQRKKTLVWFIYRISFASCMGIVVSLAVQTNADFSRKVTGFHGVCEKISRGDHVNYIRSIASQNDLITEVNPPQNEHKLFLKIDYDRSDWLAVRPNKDWPYRHACWVQLDKNQARKILKP